MSNYVSLFFLKAPAALCRDLHMQADFIAKPGIVDSRQTLSRASLA
jgi:hypothetical protein